MSALPGSVGKSSQTGAKGVEGHSPFLFAEEGMSKSK